jgi:hypothetical protein
MKFRWIVLMLLCLITLAGCQQEQANRGDSNDHSHGHSHSHASSAPEDATLPEGVDASQYVLDVEPEGAQDVIAARQSAQNDEDIVIEGRIGGGEHPWVAGRAAFSIVDPSLKACSDIPGDSCPVPWDYCCETDKLAASSALITVVDENGDVVKADARTLLQVKELSTVVVKGKARVDEEGNLIVLATGVFVRSL